MSLPLDRPPLILVVDDEWDNFQVIEILLAREAYRFEHRNTGEQALQYLEACQAQAAPEQHLPDLIFMDIMMPGWGGLETCRRIRNNTYWDHIPIMAVTALSSRSDLVDCLAAGADDFISKPLNSVELQARTRSLLRIKHQYDRLQTLLQLREDLSHMVVHDLRSPMTSIALSASVLNSLYPQDPLPQRQIRRILASVQRLQCMIDSLLMLAKLQAEKLTLQLQPVDLASVVHDAIADAQLLAQQHQVSLVTEASSTALPLLSLDPTLMRRVIDNLVDNAIKYSPAGERVVVALEGLGGQLAGQRLRLRLLDWGTGVSEDLKQRLFQKFETGDRGALPLVEQVQGITQTGLGLAFCKLAVEAHGGTITVEQNQPQGAIFTVTL